VGVDAASVAHGETEHVAVLIPEVALFDLSSVALWELRGVIGTEGARLYYRQRDGRGRSSDVYMVRAPWVTDGAADAVVELLTATGVVLAPA
jgi:hypothetical protein